MPEQPALVLASASPTRARLMRSAGLHFTARASTADEDGHKARLLARGTAPAEVAHALAAEKARSVSRELPTAIVVGADQVLDLDGEILSKARDLVEAASVLERLRGRTHRLHSAVVVASGGEAFRTHGETAHLCVRAFTDAFLSDYLAQVGDGVLHAVGCYEVEGRGLQLFDRIDGDFFAILGLPLLPLLAELRRQGALAQ